MRFALAFAVILFCARPNTAHAEEPVSLRLPTITYFSAAGADVASSLYTSHWGGREANPMVSWLEPSIGTGGMLAVGEAVDVTAVLLLQRWLGRRHPAIARAALYGAAAARFYIAAGNVRKGHEYRRYVLGGGVVVDGRGITPRP